MIRLIRTIQLALKSLMLHKLRSGLTMLGIVLGVSSVIAMLALGEGASAKAQKQVLELGATNIIIVSVKPPQETASNRSSSSFVLRYGLLRSDHDLLANTIPTVTNTVPIREINKEVRYLHREMNCRIVGCTADYSGVNHLQLARGRFITDSDQTDRRNIAVLASETASTLFPYEDPLGKAVKVAERYYTVVGVTKGRSASAAIGGSLSGQDFNKDIYVPIETLRVRMGDLIFERGQGSFSAEQIELNQITLQVDNHEQVVATADVVRETLAETHRGKKDYSVTVPLELLKQADQIKAIFNVVLGLIAAISLVVGGIGIMNIMLATVTERTREIGVRRALGARQRDITVQFLTETIVLSGTGGIIGIILGVLTPAAFGLGQAFLNNYVLADSSNVESSELGKLFADMTPVVQSWSLPLAFGISVGIGIIFGLYPRSAARLDPIEALRHE